MRKGGAGAADGPWRDPNPGRGPIYPILAPPGGPGPGGDRQSP